MITIELQEQENEYESFTIGYHLPGAKGTYSSTRSNSMDMKNPEIYRYPGIRSPHRSQHSLHLNLSHLLLIRVILNPSQDSLYFPLVVLISKPTLETRLALSELGGIRTGRTTFLKIFHGVGNHFSDRINDTDISHAPHHNLIISRLYRVSQSNLVSGDIQNFA